MPPTLHAARLSTLALPLALIVFALVVPFAVTAAATARIGRTEGGPDERARRAYTGGILAGALAADVVALCALIAAPTLISPLLVPPSISRAVARALVLPVVAKLAAFSYLAAATRIDRRLGLVTGFGGELRAFLIAGRATIPLTATFIVLASLLAALPLGASAQLYATVAVVVAATVVAPIAPSMLVRATRPRPAREALATAVADASAKIGMPESRRPRVLEVFGIGAPHVFVDSVRGTVVLTQGAADLMEGQSTSARLAIALRLCARLGQRRSRLLLTALAAFTVMACAGGALLLVEPALRGDELGGPGLLGVAATLALMARGLWGAFRTLELKAARVAASAGAAAGDYESARSALDARAYRSEVGWRSPRLLWVLVPTALGGATIAACSTVGTSAAVHAELQARTGHLDEATTPLNRALVLAPSAPETLVALANSWFRSGDAASARPVFAQALGERPDYPPAVLGLGLADAQLGNDAQSVNELHAVLGQTLLPTETEWALYVLAQTLRRDGQTDAADEFGARLQILRAQRGEPPGPPQQ
jgi:tetratricopeptide (TPR) repeat protein